MSSSVFSNYPKLFRFPFSKLLVAGLCLIVFPQGIHADEGTSELTFKPRQCVVMYRGQVCYKRVKISWALPNQGRYCLFKLNTTEPLACTEGSELLRYTDDFSSATNVQYQVREAVTQNVVADSVYSVAWVYRATRKSTSGWRLF